MPGPIPDEVYVQPPAYAGSTFTTSEPFPTLADAREYAANLMSGELDPFLGRSWTQVRISQTRLPDGRFGAGFNVDATYSRPGPGEASD